MLKLLIELFGKGYIRKIMGTRANVTKPIKMDKNSPYKLYSDKAFNDPDLLFTIEKKLEEYGPYVLSNKNASEVANYEMNARRVLNARKQKEESTVKMPLHYNRGYPKKAKEHYKDTWFQATKEFPNGRWWQWIEGYWAGHPAYGIKKGYHAPTLKVA